MKLINMVPYPCDLEKSQKPLFICISGVDGTGKTTQANLILSHLRNHGIKCKYEWFRFHHLMSLPLLVFCRIAGYTRISTIGGRECSYHEFYKSKIISRLYPWFLLADTSLFAVAKIYIPMWLGSSIVCDRFVYDTLVDISIAVRDNKIYKKRVGHLFLKLIPLRSKFIVLYLDKEEILSRRRELIDDTTFDERYCLYQFMIDELHIEAINNNRTIDETNELIENILFGDTNDSW